MHDAPSPRLTSLFCTAGLLLASDTGSPSPAEARQRARDAHFDFLAGDEIARPSTLQRLRALLDEPTTYEAIALPTAPEDLASLVTLSGGGSDGTCRTVSVAATTWPTSCSGFGDDCGRAAIEATLAGLLEAFCGGR